MVTVGAPEPVCTAFILTLPTIPFVEVVDVGVTKSYVPAEPAVPPYCVNVLI